MPVLRCCRLVSFNPPMLRDRFRAAGRGVNIRTGVGMSGPGVPRAAWCRREALPGDTEAARCGAMLRPDLVTRGGLEAVRR